MIKNMRLCGTAAVLLASTALTSCYYDPYFTSVGTTYGGTYSSSSGYYGGGGSYSSSVFISTGNSEWGYDPNCYSYYNYRRRCYYDPYLNGFYPVGYRPPVFAGCVHPHGWRPGSSYCPPPHRVSNITIVNYRNRESAYRSAGYIQHNHREQYATQQARPQTKPSFFQRPEQQVNPQQNHTRPAPGFQQQQQNRPSREPSRVPQAQQPQTRPSGFNTLVNTAPQPQAQARPSFGSTHPSVDRGQQTQTSRPSFGGDRMSSRDRMAEAVRKTNQPRTERVERKKGDQQEVEQAQP